MHISLGKFHNIGTFEAFILAFDTVRRVVVLPWVEGTLVALECLEVPLGELCYLPVLRRRTDMTPEDRGRFQITP